MPQPYTQEIAELSQAFAKQIPNGTPASVVFPALAMTIAVYLVSRSVPNEHIKIIMTALVQDTVNAASLLRESMD